jgi:hypothetical protein
VTGEPTTKEKEDRSIARGPPPSAQQRPPPPPPPTNPKPHSNDSIFSRLVPTVLGMGAVTSVLFGAKSLLFDESGN